MATLNNQTTHQTGNQTVELSKLTASKDNVRRVESEAGLSELVASIRAHGLLQNLTVRPNDKGKYEVVAGARRLVVGIEFEQGWRDGSQSQTLFHHRDRHEKGRGDCLVALALFAQCHEGPVLVERMQRHALDILGERVIGCQNVGAWISHDARHRAGLGETLLLHQQLQRPEAATAGGNLVQSRLNAVSVEVRIPTKSVTDSDLNPAMCSDLKSARIPI